MTRRQYCGSILYMMMKPRKRIQLFELLLPSCLTRHLAGPDRLQSTGHADGKARIPHM